MLSLRHVRAASFLLIAATFPAAAAQSATGDAQAPATAPEVQASSVDPGEAPTSQKAASPWRGSSLTYGHAATTVSLDKGALPFYDPELRAPARAGAAVELQRAALRARPARDRPGVHGRRRHRVPPRSSSPTSRADVGTSGWMEPRTGIKDQRRPPPDRAHLEDVPGAVEALLRRSPAGPLPQVPGAAGADRSATTPATPIASTATPRPRTRRPGCSPAPTSRRSTASSTAHTGRRNVMQDVLHGASVLFQPLEKLSVTSSLMWSHGFLYALTPTDIPVRDESARERRLRPLRVDLLARRQLPDLRRARRGRGGPHDQSPGRGRKRPPAVLQPIHHAVPGPRC